ncbi:hypothetical protein PUN28_010967 [Cardiocondyla obscurior]|uniref:Uncharacterized protein n=1 Tax=Cardiocondyla obscurior TaxID=286306 RepID=A0AAW2FKM3_9HYME
MSYLEIFTVAAKTTLPLLLYSHPARVRAADYYAITLPRSFRPRVSARKIVNEHSSGYFASLIEPPAFCLSIRSQAAQYSRVAEYLEEN